MPIISALVGWRPEDQKLKVLNYMNLRPAYMKSISKNKRKKIKENLKQNKTKPKQLKCEFLLEEVTVFLMYSSAGPTAHTCVYLKRRQETASVSTPYFLGSQLWFECAMSPIG